MKPLLKASLIVAIAAAMFSCGRIGAPDFSDQQKHCVEIGRVPALEPDYAGIAIPPNIGPLNFTVKDSGTAFYVRISSKNGEPIVLWSRSPSVRIPQKQWTVLLSRNKGEMLRLELLARNISGDWVKYRDITDTISKDDIDPYIVYRTIGVLYNFSRDICLYQRDLTKNKEFELLNALRIFPGCVNCHTLRNNDPNSLFIHVRTRDLGSSALCAINGKVEKINAKFQYTSWHPSGKLIAYSINKVDQCFHSTWKDLRDVFDHTSGILIYNVEKRRVVTVPQLFRQEALETWPCWSADGKALYFCSGPILWDDLSANPPPNIEKVRYSLMQVSYDQQRDAWGMVDTVLSSARTGLSITQPRVSPDNKYILFCMHAYGPSPYAQQSSDLYLLDIATKQYRALDNVNSPFSESWHSWSSNGRWIAFSSKKQGGILTRIYFSHIDENGKSSKAFLMPQNDPAFYDSFIKVYNVPEFATGPITVGQKALLHAIRSHEKIDVGMPVTGATPKKNQQETSDPWPQMSQPR